MNISWTEAPDASYYLVFKRKMQSILDDWEMVSTFSFEESEPIKVLNIYPSEDGRGDSYCHTGRTVPSASFVFANGTQKTFPKSAGLKIWIEGGSVDNEQMENLGENPITGEQAIQVDSISVLSANANPSVIWSYDAVAFGTWDGGGFCEFGGPLYKVPNDNLIREVEKYIEARHSVIISHDNIAVYSGSELGLGQIRHLFKVLVGGGANVADVDAKGVPMTTEWRSNGVSLNVVRSGPVVDYPWNLSGRTLNTYLTHTWGNLALGDIWMTIIPSEVVYEFVYDTTGFPAGSDTAYLSTVNNTAMIQTGHSKCNATVDERKIWANLIYYLRKRTQRTSHVDHSCFDQDAPMTPTCSCMRYENNMYDIMCKSDDAETMYQYRVEAYNEANEIIAASDSVSIDFASDFSHFVYANDDQNSLSSEDLLSHGVESNGVYSGALSGRFLHVVAVDQIGNVSPPLHYDMSKCHTPSLKFTDELLRNAKNWRCLVLLYYCHYLITA